MKVRSSFVGLACAALTTVVVACDGGEGASTPTSPAPSEPTPTPTPVVESAGNGFVVTIHMSAPTGSFQVGGAVVRSDGDGTLVIVDVEPPSDTAQPIHIHAGTCDDVGDIVHTLENVVRGHSETQIDAPVTEILSGERLINIHRSFQDFPTYTACGELPDLGG